MKAGREHRVPLSPQAMAIVSALHEDGETGFVFSGTSPDKPLSIMAMSMLLRRMKAGVTVHGFRSSFRDWASETTGFPRSEEHTSELQSLMRISYAVFCLKKNKN